MILFISFYRVGQFWNNPIWNFVFHHQSSELHLIGSNRQVKSMSCSSPLKTLSRKSVIVFFVSRISLMMFYKLKTNETTRPFHIFLLKYLIYFQVQCLFSIGAIKLITCVYIFDRSILSKQQIHFTNLHSISINIISRRPFSICVLFYEI